MMYLSPICSIGVPPEDNYEGFVTDMFAPEWRKESVEERLKYALRKGITDFLQQDIDAIIKELEDE